MNMYKYYPLIKSPFDHTKYGNTWICQNLFIFYIAKVFFYNTSKFGDPFEGSLPEFNKIDGQKEYPISKDLLPIKKISKD